MKKYEHKKIEQRWQKVWEKEKVYRVADEVKGRENFYTLVEFPYPSGNLHVGHWYAFSVPDIFARFRKMRGFNVLFPIGFDAFGLPAENAALKRGLNPRRWTVDNIDYMKKQLRTMGASFDWSREVRTCDPAYYKWTQWLFLQFFKAGLAYQAETNVNWCPSCRTVLANEQVVAGRCERCDSVVEQRKMKQWLLKITDYAEKLLKGLEKLDWPEEIKESQRNWIGKSEGVEIEFRIVGSTSPALRAPSPRQGREEWEVKVFTTRPDTIFGATYLVLAPEHSLINNFQFSIFNFQEVQKYIERAKRKTELQRLEQGKEKTGVELKGIRAINPATKEEIPVWVADYVLATYGTGAIMAVPAHDERDWEFAKKFNLPIKQVVAPLFVSEDDPPKKEMLDIERQAMVIIVRNPKNHEYLCLQWKAKSSWRTFVTGGIEEGEDVIAAAKREVLEETGYKNLKLVKKFDLEAHEHFFHVVKKENRYAHFTGLVFDLIDEKQKVVHESEKNLHQALWIQEKDVENFIGAKVFKYFWKTWRSSEQAYVEPGVLINSGKFSGIDSERAKWGIMGFVKGVKKVQYKLRDWVISRQRYWGAPIPLVFCKSCAEKDSGSTSLPTSPLARGEGLSGELKNPGWIPIPEKDLPVKLPELKDYKPQGDGKSPLAKVQKWVKVKCPNCGSAAERETDTMDTFVDSSWYFLRYTDPMNRKQFADQKKMTNWMPVDRYSGGAEHTTMHLLYSRFWVKAMHDLKLVKWEEPYAKRMNRGLILGPDGQKMSKSRGNVVDPDNYVRELGADTVRMYLAFIGPYNEVGAYPWDPKGILGVRRFLEKVWRLFQESGERPLPVRPPRRTDHPPQAWGGEGGEVERQLHKTIKKVTEDIENFKFNTAVSAMMVLMNEFSTSSNSITGKHLEMFLKLLAPFAPHLAEELWRKNLGHKTSIHLEPWPKHDEKLTKEDIINLPVQINGRVRAMIKVEAQASEDEVKKLALSDETIHKRLAGKSIKKVIYVKGKIINFVVT